MIKLLLILILFSNAIYSQTVPVRVRGRRIHIVSPARHNIIFQENFERDTAYDTYVGQQFATPYAFGIVSDTVFQGIHAGRVELRAGDPPPTSTGTRSEVLFPLQDSLERWYSFSVYHPSASYLKDSLSSEIINQWFQSGGSNPSIALITKNDRYRMDIRWIVGNSNYFDLGLIPKDQWNTFVFHILHSYDSSKGMIDIWMNGTKLMTYRGPCMYDPSDTSIGRPRWKVGIYKWDWNYGGTTATDKRVFYYDNVRLGNENASYDEMIYGD